MNNSKRQIDTLTRINILYGSRPAKLLVIFATMMLALLTNMYRVYTANSLIYIVLSILAYGVLFANYFKNINILQYGVLTKGNFQKKEATKFYNQGTLGSHYFCKYFFRIKDLQGKQYDLIKWTTKDNGFEGTKKPDILYSLKNPKNALVIDMLQGGPYAVADDRVYSRLRMANIFNALLTTAGIVFVFFYLS